MLNKPEICIERIKERVKQGGHYVPDEDVIRRFARSKNNFWKTYKNIADFWFIYNNSNIKPEEIAIGKGREVTIIREDLFEEYQKGIK